MSFYVRMRALAKAFGIAGPVALSACTGLPGDPWSAEGRTPTADAQTFYSSALKCLGRQADSAFRGRPRLIAVMLVEDGDAPGQRTLPGPTVGLLGTELAIATIGEIRSSSILAAANAQYATAVAAEIGRRRRGPPPVVLIITGGYKRFNAPKREDGMTASAGIGPFQGMVGRDRGELAIDIVLNTFDANRMVVPGLSVQLTGRVERIRDQFRLGVRTDNWDLSLGMARGAATVSDMEIARALVQLGLMSILARQLDLDPSACVTSAHEDAVAATWFVEADTAGQRSEFVRRLTQMQLLRGPATATNVASAISAFQHRHALAVSGQVTLPTFVALVRATRSLALPASAALGGFGGR